MSHVSGASRDTRLGKAARVPGVSWTVSDGLRGVNGQAPLVGPGDGLLHGAFKYDHILQMRYGAGMEWIWIFNGFPVELAGKPFRFRPQLATIDGRTCLGIVLICFECNR